MLFQQIFYGAILIAVGVVTLKYNFQIVQNTSRLEWIESKLGSGSTFLVYKILSVVLVIAGILYMTGFGNAVLTWLLSPLANLLNPNR
jgi:hypothetical protein